MRTSLALSAARRVGYVATRRVAVRAPVVYLSTSASSKYGSNMDIIDEVNRTPPPLAKEFAVDAPDGETDGHFKEDVVAANETINETARIENSAEFLKTQAEMRATFAVDAPDGETDAHIQEDLMAANETIDETARIENSEAFLKTEAEMRKTFAVDAPDGEVDGHFQEELEEINHIIDDASKLENKSKIDEMHHVHDEVEKEAERHPEHDW